MRKSSQIKSRKKREPKNPLRVRGQKRVSELLDAALVVFSMKGYEGATMTEIAQKAGASIGSLYQFFPDKESLADALVFRYRTKVGSALGTLEEQAADLKGDELASRLLGLLLNLKKERAVALALFEARTGTTVTPGQLRTHIRKRVAGILRIHNPQIKSNRADAASVLITQLMKSAVAIDAEGGSHMKSVQSELNRMMNSYVKDLNKA